MSAKQEATNSGITKRANADLAGRFIAIEGVDGSGKTTQIKLLVDHLRSLGQHVLEIKFPRYGKDSAYYIERYLNGDYGSAEDVPADLGVLPYALDRFAAKDEIVEHLKKPNSFVIADRYMASNLAHQGAKIDDTEKRHEFYERTLRTEYEILGIPRPDLNIVLLIPPAVAQSNVDKKGARTYTSAKRDIHEADSNHLANTNQNYEEICQLYPDEFSRVHCTEINGEMRSIEEISSSIRAALSAAPGDRSPQYV